MSELKANAERNALKATELPAFRRIALSGLKDNVAEMLNMIGRVRELFATYTKHDISHIDAMLGHLDWLIPPSTQNEMTPTDWLLITLSIYLHDLGMLVTAEEFDKRMENPAFRTFLDGIKNDPKSQDYLGRTRKMSEEEREKFFFQEFIRDSHAARIKEWITGRHLRHWGTPVQPIADAVCKLLDPLPSRFRENLATVCESHHESNLNRLDLYPLCQPYGNDPLEIANVQFAALLLRTADLIHVTKDRTPSMMYKTIRLSDPKGVAEWDKQKDTFSVRHQGRTFDPNDTGSHVITVSADFTEERPFFALTEYLAWADSEIKQTKRWSDQSREQKDAADFWLPWHTIRGDLRVEGNQPQQMRFELDRGRLLDLLVGHAIYNEPTVAIRELLQNAIDAVRFQHHIDSKRAEADAKPEPTMGKVSVSWDAETRRLVVEDTGTGMDLDIIKFHLMRVGSSYYGTPQFAVENKAFNPISRFGIGILTCFMISDEIEIITFRERIGHRIKMTSVHADYLLRELASGEPMVTDLEPHGTRVTLIIREGVDFRNRSLEDILRYWVVLPACRVEYREHGKDPVRIGYDSPESVLTHRLQKAYGDREKPEVISKRRVINGGSYEMAIALQSRWFPEKSFVSLRPEPSPRVCLEGICVSEVFPGFKDSEKLCALVSVRGVRDLRTTVSRSGLEEDEASLSLGKICSDMMFEHVQDEVQRISGGEGKPLSRASTAAKWLSGDVLAMAGPGLTEHVNTLRSQLPIFVLETTEAAQEPSRGERRLVSCDELCRIPYFWTIESRLVDSLGIISRDLGRELSLNEFLHALVPDLKALRYSPILPDGHLFRRELLLSHRPVLVQFSRRHQQTAIKWLPGVNPRGDDLWEAIRKDPAFFPGVWKWLSENGFEHMDPFELACGSSSHPEERMWVEEVDVAGDDPNIKVVHTRIMSMIARDSEAARVQDLLRRALSWATVQKERTLCAQLLVLCSVLDHLLKSSGHMEETIYHERGERRKSETRRRWEERATECNEIMKRSGGDIVIPEELCEISPKMVFDASSYWRDWHRTKEPNRGSS